MDPTIKMVPFFLKHKQRIYFKFLLYITTEMSQ